MYPVIAYLPLCGHTYRCKSQLLHTYMYNNIYLHMIHLLGALPPDGGTTYYYGNNRFHARFPFDQRKLDDDDRLIQSIADEDRPTRRESMSRNSGYTGRSNLHQLKKLYGFDVSKDLVYDMMHNIPLNVVSSLLNGFIATNAFDPVVVDNMLKRFPWTSGN